MFAAHRHHPVKTTDLYIKSNYTNTNIVCIVCFIPTKYSFALYKRINGYFLSLRATREIIMTHNYLSMCTFTIQYTQLCVLQYEASCCVNNKVNTRKKNCAYNKGPRYTQQQVTRDLRLLVNKLRHGLYPLTRSVLTVTYDVLLQVSQTALLPTQSIATACRREKAYIHCLFIQ